jgi:predicted O-linked N-acetylglucosamine transferase (SPINDLY family)
VRYGLESELRNSVKQQLNDSKHPEHLAPLWNPQKLARNMYNLLQNLISKS